MHRTIERLCYPSKDASHLFSEAEAEEIRNKYPFHQPDLMTPEEADNYFGAASYTPTHTNPIPSTFTFTHTDPTPSTSANAAPPQGSISTTLDPAASKKKRVASIAPSGELCALKS